MMNFWNKFLSFMTPFVKWWGKLHWPFSVKKITGDEYYLWRDDINKGTILLSKTGGQLSNLINPTQIKHGAIYVGRDDGGKICYVAEALGQGVVKNNLVKFMTTKDIIVVVRPKFATKEQLEKVAEAAKKFVGTPYDYLFESGDSALYCFELCIKSFQEVFPEKQFKYHEIVKGKRIYDETTFLEDPNNWEVVIDSREYFKNKGK